MVPAQKLDLASVMIEYSNIQNKQARCWLLTSRAQALGSNRETRRANLMSKRKALACPAPPVREDAYVHAQLGKQIRETEVGTVPEHLRQKYCSFIQELQTLQEAESDPQRELVKSLGLEFFQGLRAALGLPRESMIAVRKGWIVVQAEPVQ